MPKNNTSVPLNSQASARSVSNSLLAWFICLFATTFLLYEFVLQVSPSVMTGELMHDLRLNATGLGAMTAFYYYAYTPMQLPAGLLLDRWGPRILLTLATLTCAVGALSFGMALTASLAAVGRFLMGIGSAFAFIGALMLVARWFPPHYFAALTGVVQMASSIGAIAGQAPLAAAINAWGWRNTLLNLALLGFGLTGLIWLIVRDSPHGSTVKRPIQNKNTPSFKQELQRLKQVLTKSQTWWVGLYSFTVWAPITAFAALWGIPFLVQHYALSTTAASNACAMIWLGIGVGSPLLGAWSDRIQRRRLPLTVSSLLGIISLSLVIYWPLSTLSLYSMLFITGLAATGQALAFGLVKDNNRPEVTGTAIGFNNMAVVAGGALFQPLIGWLLAVGSSHPVNEVATYSLTAYQNALVTLPICYAISAIISHFFLKETYCKAQY